MMQSHAKEMPLQMVGSCKFGRYSKISVEQTWNMFVSDGWLVPYAGFKKSETIQDSGSGRGLFNSVNSGKMIAVVDNAVYSIDQAMAFTVIGFLDTFIGDISMDENDAKQIIICDGKNNYVWDYETNVFQKLDLDFTPGYVTFQDGYFISPISNQAKWRLSVINAMLGLEATAIINGGTGYLLNDILNVDGGIGGQVKVTGVSGTIITAVTLQNAGKGYAPGAHTLTGGSGSGATANVTISNGFPAAPANVGLFQTKPDTVSACVRIPGKEGYLFVMGKTCTELWKDVGYKLFPYQRSSGFNIDYGCANPATVASGDQFVVWLGTNEKAGPVIMYSNGGEFKSISTDGIDYKLAQLKHPEKSYGFLFKQDGHLFYQLTFYDPADNITYAYDFNTNQFYFLCDVYMNYHPAKRVVAFNNSYYFVSLGNGNLYELNSKYTTHDGNELVKIRILPTIRTKNTSPFILKNMVFPIEQGANEELQRVDVSLSMDGGVSFGNTVSYTLNDIGKRQNRLVIWVNARCNEFTPQFRFWGTDRFIFTDGVAGISQ